MKDKLTYVLLGLLVGIVLTWIFLTTAVGQYQGAIPMMGLRSGMSGAVDEHFIESMIPHHNDAITMANLALTYAEHPEIKILAGNIIKTQSAEIDQMKQWYQSWFGRTVPEVSNSLGYGMGMMMHGGMMGDASDFDRLKTAQSFDKAFIEEMIPHHQMAVMMAQMLKNSTSRPEMKKLAEDIMTAQTREINDMRNWYRDWYGQ